MLQMANTMGTLPVTTIRGLGDGAAWPIKNAVTKSRGELEDYIRTHWNPAGAVTPLQKAITHGVSPSRSNNQHDRSHEALARPQLLDRPAQGPAGADR